MSAVQPGAMAPEASPSACAPPRRAASNRWRPVEAAGGPQAVALALAQALAVLERAQLLAQRDAHVAVRADGEAAAGLQEARRLEDAVAEVGLGDGAQAGHGAGAGERAASPHGVMCVQWIRHQRSSTCMLSSSHSTGGAPDQAMHSSTSAVCSAAWMWMGPDGHSSRTSVVQLRRIDRAQRMRGDAEHRRRRRGRRAVRLAFDQTPEAVEVGQKARLARLGRASRRSRRARRSRAAARARCRSPAPPRRCARPSRRDRRSGRRAASLCR